MKKTIVVSIVVVFGLFMLSSCNIEELKEKYGSEQIEQNNTKTGHESIGDNEDTDDEETGGE